MRADPFARPDELLRRVYAYVAYLVQDGAEAEDITSETFERALRYRESYDPRRGEPAAWLLGIARRCVYDASRRPRHLAADEERGDVTADHADAAVSRVELRAALSALGGADRELLALRYGADLTTREMAQVLDMQRNAVDVALSRARARLRGLLDAPQSSEQPASPAEPAPNRL